MRTLALATLSALALGLGGSSPDGASADHARGFAARTRFDCARTRYVVAADTRARVYSAREPASGLERLRVYGCAYGQDRRYDLGLAPYGGTPSGAGGVERETLAGSLVAYEWEEIGETIKEEFIVVRDLRNGRVVRRLPTGSRPTPAPYQVGIGGSTDLVVKPDGAVAWIVRTSEDLGAFQVHAADRLGSRVVATGPDIAPGSLALAGSTLYWMQGGRAFSASLD